MGHFFWRAQGQSEDSREKETRRLTGGLPLLRVKAGQPEVRLAEVAAVVALLPIWEVPGLADLHPYLSEEFGDGDEALVVCPEGSDVPALASGREAPAFRLPQPSQAEP